MSRTVIESIEGEYRRYSQYALDSLAQLEAEMINAPGPGGNNSIDVIVQHVSGNLRSRFTDFLTADGEKPDRNRDGEFEERTLTLEEARALWDRGFAVLYATLATLDDSHLSHTVTIRGQTCSVLEALHRSLAHTVGHAAQIVYLAKSLRGEQWRTLTIPRGQSDAFNRNPVFEKPPK